MSPTMKAALERGVRTVVQAAAGAALVVLLHDGASWSVVPEALSVGAFAGLISLVTMFAAPPKTESPN